MAVTVQEWDSGISTPLSKVFLLLGSGNGTFRPSELLSMEDERFLVGLATEDFDRDGNIDILVTTSGQGDYPFGLTILMGDGNGGFSRKFDHNINLDLNYLARVKDINGDKTADIVLLGYYKAYVFLGRGDGTFKDPMEFNVSGDELNMGDFDGDGAEDIITSANGQIFMVFGNGDGTFIDRKEIVTSTQSPFISSADFDGDNSPDFARAGGGTYEGLLFSTITNKGGSWSEDIFKGDEKYNVGSGPGSLKMGDLNGDAHLDIVTANELSEDVTVLLNNGDGGLKTAGTYPVGKMPNFIAIEDLNGDGYPDIITANKSSDDISILIGKGNGTFQVQKIYAVGSSPSDIVVGDFNSDSNPDIVVANSGWSSNTVSLLLGNGDGTFKPQLTHVVVGQQPSSIVKGDFNEDGYLDLAVLSYTYYWGGAISHLTLLLGKGDGTFINKDAILENPNYQGCSFHRILAEDFNRDGKLDLITLNNGSCINPVVVFLGDGNGRFQRSQIVQSDTTIPSALGDINNDGNIDLLLHNANSLAIWLGQGDGTFKESASIGGRDAVSMDIGDINGDGVSDIALVDHENLSVIFGYGGGVFPGESIIYGDKYKEYRYLGTSLATADFNGDRNQDIVVRMGLPSPGGYPIGESKIAIYWGTGYNTFKQSPPLEILGYQGGEILTGDFNSDGLPDIAVKHWNSDSLSTFLNKGNGIFDTAIPNLINGSIKIAKDVNNDGHLDLVGVVDAWNGWEHSYSVPIYTGNGNGTFQYHSTISLDTYPFDITTGDFNGDGFLDLAIGKDYNRIEIWGNDGNGVFFLLSVYSVEGLKQYGSWTGALISEDFNGDGIVDIGVMNALLLGNGDGTFKHGGDYSFGTGMISRDYNRDGRPDIAAIGSNGIQLILNQLPPLHTPPSPPKRLAGKPGDGSVSLSWAANPETDIAGYNVYRSLSAGGGYVKLNNAPLTAMSYTDSTLANGTAYYYTVSAVDKDGDESSYAVKVKVMPNPPDTTPPIVKITTPVNSGRVYSPKLFVLGEINETDSKVTVNGVSGTIQKNDNTFTAYGIPLSIGDNTITVTAVDAAGNPSSDSINVVYIPASTVTGVVKDELTGQPLDRATVTVADVEKSQELTTGPDGKYFFGKLIPGEVIIRVDASDHDRVTLKKALSSGEALNFDILLPLYPATLRGGVYNNYTYRGISGATATVTDRKKSQSATTGTWGDYTVENITPYDVTIAVSKEGYETYTESRKLSNWYTNWGYFYLKQLPPSTPTGLTAASGAGYVTLAWNHSPEDLLGYNIYRSTIPGTGYIKLNQAPVTTLFYKDMGVISGVAYYYVLTAVNTSAMESAYSIETSFIYIEQKVFSPTGLTATAGAGYIDLAWNQNQEDDISGYKVYRSTVSGTGYAYIGTTSGTSLRDTTVTGETAYYYAVTAVNTLLRESGYSKEASATPRDVIPPTGLTATAGEGFVELPWSPSPDSDISYYKIYRTTAQGANYTYISNASGTYYKDKSVTGGITYYYVVTAVNAYSKESPYSNEASATTEVLKVSVTITSPRGGEWINGSEVIVRGTVTASSTEAGVVIETGEPRTGAYARYLAQVNGQNFAATVNLREGFSYIKATAIDYAGNKAEATIMVNSMPTTETIRLKASPESGILTLKERTNSLDVTLKVDISISNPILTYSWDFNGDGRPEQVGSLSEATASYQYPGLYFPTVTVTDTEGNTYSATTVVSILDRDEIDTLLKSKWEGMRGALGSDTAKALNYFDESVKDKFNRVFSDLGSDLLSIAASFEDITLISFDSDIAEYAIGRNQDGQRYIYFIYFMKDKDGIWKVKGM